MGQHDSIPVLCPGRGDPAWAIVHVSDKPLVELPVVRVHPGKRRGADPLVWRRGRVPADNATAALDRPRVRSLVATLWAERSSLVGVLVYD